MRTIAAQNIILTYVYSSFKQVDRHSTVKKIQRFLMVKPRKLWPDIKAKPRRKLSESIANFEELRTTFAKTEWRSFFNDKEEVIHISKPD